MTSRERMVAAVEFSFSLELTWTRTEHGEL